MPALLKKYQALTPDQSPFKLMDEMSTLVKKHRSTYPGFAKNPNAFNSHIKYFTITPPTNNVPIKVGSKEEMYDEMRKAINEMDGTNFVLGMLTDEGKYEVWRRPSQPCQGGEMRKYGITHDDSTRPLDPRPGDLKYPFPDGKPLAVGARVVGLKNSHPYQIHPHSVYRRAYGTEENVELVNGAKGMGLIALNADLVEPTAMVTLLRDARHWGKTYDFLSPTANFLLFRLTNQMGGIHWYEGNHNNDHEHNTSYINLKKISKGGIEASRDLSGGVLGKRFDYNRPEIEYIWKGDVGENVSMYSVVNDIFFGGKKSDKSYSFEIPCIKKFATEIEQYLKEF